MLEMRPKFEPKNRYSDILPFKHSRVHLVPRQSISGGDDEVNAYINANFVDGPLGVNDRKIIGSQGPKSNTYSDFWRMVSQENVTLIVTTCNVVENGRSKCHEFWPNDMQEGSKLWNHNAILTELDKVGISVVSAGQTV